MPSKHCLKAVEDDVFGELSKHYGSEGAVSSLVNVKLASQINKMVRISHSEEKRKDKKHEHQTLRTKKPQGYIRK